MDTSILRNIQNFVSKILLYLLFMTIIRHKIKRWVLQKWHFARLLEMTVVKRFFCKSLTLKQPEPSLIQHWLDCVNSVRIRSFPGPYFPAFGLNTERYSVRVSLCIQSECGKLQTRKTPNTDSFHAVAVISGGSTVFEKSKVQLKWFYSFGKNVWISIHCLLFFNLTATIKIHFP